ncbi:MAG: Rieske 2Fe-2S domain-containing protein [Candidatus Binatia bacterium]
MAFQRVCSLDDLWEGEMAAFEVEGRAVLLVHLPGGVVSAIQAICPHQSQPLLDGELEGTLLTCKAHRWEFDVATAKSVNPEGTDLCRFPVKIEGDDVWVDVAGAPPDVAFQG